MIAETYKKLLPVKSPHLVEIGGYSDDEIRRHGANLMTYTELIRMVGELVIEADHAYNVQLHAMYEQVGENELTARAFTKSSKEKYCKSLCIDKYRELQLLKNKLSFIVSSKEDTLEIINIYKKLREGK